MGNIPADVIRVFEDDASNFTGERLKKGQFALCRNVPIPTKGWELFWRDLTTGVYHSHSLEVDLTDYSVVELLTPTTQPEFQALITAGKTVFIADPTTGDARIPDGTYQLLDHTYHFIGGLQDDNNIKMGDVTFLAPATPTGNSTLEFKGGVSILSGATVEINTEVEIIFETVTLEGNCTLDANANTTKIEVLNTGTYSISEGDAGDTINYQYITGTGGIKDSGAVDVTEAQQEYWKYPLDPVIFGKKQIIKGYVDYTTIEAVFSAGKIIVSSTTGTVKFFSDKKYYEFTNGDSHLELTVPSVNQMLYTYHDSDGQLQFETEITVNTVRNYCLGPLARYDTDLSTVILLIYRTEAAEANEIENEASYGTKSIQPTSETVTFTGTILGNVIGHSGGTYYTNRDKRFEFLAIAGGSKQWTTYCLEGLDANGVNRICVYIPPTLGVPYVTDIDAGLGATGRLVYNFFDGTDFELVTLANNTFCAIHFGVADGTTRNVIALVGQASYGSISAARNGLADERNSLVGDTTVFRDVGIVASCIFKSDGTLQYVDASNNLFDYVTGGVVSAGGGSAASLASVLAVGNDANALQIKNLTDPTDDQDAATKKYVDGNSTTYLPVLEFGGASVGMTYAIQEGWYRVAGGMVDVSIRLLLSNKGTSTGSASITLPTSVEQLHPSSSICGTAVVGLVGGMGGAQIVPKISATSGTLSFTTFQSTTDITDSAFTNTTSLQLSARYKQGA